MTGFSQFQRVWTKYALLERQRKWDSVSVIDDSKCVKEHDGCPRTLKVLLLAMCHGELYSQHIGLKWTWERLDDKVLPELELCQNRSMPTTALLVQCSLSGPRTPEKW